MSSERERSVMLFVPALLVLIGYSWFWYRPMMNSLQAKEEKLEKASTGAVTRETVRSAERQRDELQAAIKDLQAKLADVASHNSAVTHFSSKLDSTDAALELTRLFKANQLVIEEAEVASSDVAKGVVPTSLTSAVDKLRSKPLFCEPVLYRVRFLGRYPDVLVLLKQINAQSVALPLHLQMDEVRQETPWRYWTLFAWL